MGKKIDRSKVKEVIVKELSVQQSTKTTKEIHTALELTAFRMSGRSVQRILNEMCTEGTIARTEKQMKSRKVVFWSLPIKKEEGVIKQKLPGRKMETTAKRIPDVPETHTPPAIGRYRVMVERHDGGDVYIFRGYKQRHVINQCLDFLDDKYKEFPKRRFNIILFDDLDNCRKMLSKEYRIGRKREFNMDIKSRRTKIPAMKTEPFAPLPGIIPPKRKAIRSDIFNNMDPEELFAVLHIGLLTLARKLNFGMKKTATTKAKVQVPKVKPAAKAKPAAPKKSKRTKYGKGGSGLNPRKHIENMISEGKYTPKQIKETILRTYPDIKQSYLTTLLGRAKSAKYPAYKQVAKVNSKGIIHF